MLHFIQLLKLIDNRQLFYAMFSDLDYELNELGFKDCPEELISDILYNHFGLSIDCPKQLQRITATILKYNKDLEKMEMLFH